MRAALCAISAFLLGASTLLAGSAGVRNGSISGRVLGSDLTPIAGAFVVAQRNDQDPKVIRSTRTDAQGRYFLGLPTGAYTIGFSAFGFRTIDTREGDPNNQTALGAQVRAFVESGSNSLIQDVDLKAVPPSGNGSTVIGLTDAVTGDPVGDATVIVGSAATTQGSNGVFRLQVPVQVGDDGQLSTQPVSIQADGFRAFESEVKVVPNVEQRFTFALQPRLGIQHRAQ